MVSCQKRWILLSTNSVALFSFVVFKLDANEKEQLESSLDESVHRCRSALHMPSSLLPTKRSVSSPRDARQHNAQKMLPQIVPFHSIILGKHWAQIICRNYEEMQILPLPLERRIISQGKTGPSRGANGEENKHEVGDASAVQTNKPTNKQIKNVLIHIWSSEDFFLFNNFFFQHIISTMATITELTTSNSVRDCISNHILQAPVQRQR